jgi:hypothetical protein
MVTAAAGSIALVIGPMVKAHGVAHIAAGFYGGIGGRAMITHCISTAVAAIQRSSTFHQRLTGQLGA